MLHGNSVCAEQVCIQKSLQGVLDMGAASTQNASGIVPWLNAIDFPYMFQSNGQLYNFFRSEEHTSELQSLMRISYAVFCLKKKKEQTNETTNDSSNNIRNK